MIIHLTEGIDIPSISSVYTEAHNTSHARTRLQGDVVVNRVLDHTLQRESAYTRTHCTTTVAEQVFQDTLHLNVAEGEETTFTREQEHLRRQFNSKIRKQVRNATREKAQEALQQHAKGLQLQGHLLTLASMEKEDLLWKSFMFQLKAGTLKFMINASVDTLPTPANLYRWKYSTSSKCKLCGNYGTTNHILNCCKIMPDTDRYTWRHNNLVNFIVNNVDKHFEVFSDLPGMEAPGGGTIPPALCVTRLKPDIVIVDSHTKTLHIYELTMPLSRNITARHKEKHEKYTPFLTDITGYKTTLNCFEISSTGFITKENHETLGRLHKFMRKDLKKTVFKNNLNALSWYGSYQIWFSRENHEFTAPPYLIPHISDLPTSCEGTGRARAQGRGL